MKLTLRRTLPYILLIASVIGLAASFALTYDKIHILQNPAYSPACNINPILSCGSIMQAEQSSLLGIPNPIFGLIGFSILGTFAIALLAGVKFPRRFWQAINIGALAALIFSYYLFFQGIYRLNAICPYCFVIWMVTPPIIWYITLYNLREGYIKLGLSIKVKNWLQRHHGDILLAWYLFIAVLLTTHFWYYWKTLF